MRTVCSMERCDAFFLGLRPVDHPVCVCQCRDDASLAACYRSFQPRLRRSGLGLRSASATDPLRRHPRLRRPLEVWWRNGVASALRFRAGRSAFLYRHLLDRADEVDRIYFSASRDVRLESGMRIKAEVREPRLTLL